MANLLSFQPQSLLLSPFPGRNGAPGPVPQRSHFGFLSKSPSPFLLRGSLAARLGSSPHLPVFETAEGLAGELFGRLEGLVYTVADAAVSSDAATQSSKQSGDWLSGITNYLETVLKVLKDGLSALHVPYAYGFAIILLTVLVKAATFPLTKKQVESALAMRSLQPQVKAIQQRYAGNQEQIQHETARLYKLAGVNPLAGCLPTLATIPVWIGLYRALSNVANEGLLTEGFFWIPSLSGPTTIAARQSGSGTSWLFPFIDGHPPLGWSDTLAYLVLPVLLVLSQYVSAQIMQPPQSSDPSQKSSQALTKFLPLMIGYFALSVPSGLSLYWITNNILSTAQQIWLQKLGGANNPVKEYIDKTRDDSSNIPNSVSNIQKNSVSNIQKSLLDIETEKAKSREGEKANPGGLQPGERFKQIKEQEARRRKQREEEKKRAEEAAEGSRMIIEAQNSELESLESKNELEPRKDPTDSDLSTSNSGGPNGNAGSVMTNDRSLHENAQMEETEAHASTGNQTSHDAIDRRDQETQ